MLNVKDFGAQGDGVSKDTAPLRAALLINACDGDISDVTFQNNVMEQTFPGTALCFTANEGVISNIKVENFRFRGNGAGYFYAEKNGRIDGVTVKNCIFEIEPKPKAWGDGYDAMITHAYSLPYRFVLKNADNVTFDNADIHIGDFDLSEYTPSDLAALKDAIGPERFNAILAPVKETISSDHCKNFRKI